MSKVSARAAGVLVRAADTGRVLLLLRSDAGSAAGVWSIPGGMVEPGETWASAALRELREETGFELSPKAPKLDAAALPIVRDDYMTFPVVVAREFAVELNGEHVDAGWFVVDEATLPTPLHPGVRAALEDLRHEPGWSGA